MNDKQRIDTMRAELLHKAVEDAIYWCFNPETNERSKRVSDQYWFMLFSGRHTVDLTDAHKFLVTYQLTKMRNWDKQAVTDLINGLVKKPDFNPTSDIPAFAELLGGCITSKNASTQTSAARKIAMYAKPSDDEVHINLHEASG